MQQGVLSFNCFKWKTKPGIRELVRQGFSRCANRIATFQNAMFAEHNYVLGIVMLQVAVDVAALAPPKVIFEHFNRRARTHS